MTAYEIDFEQHYSVEFSCICSSDAIGIGVLLLSVPRSMFSGVMLVVLVTGSASRVLILKNYAAFFRSVGSCGLVLVRLLCCAMLSTRRLRFGFVGGIRFFCPV